LREGESSVTDEVVAVSVTNGTISSAGDEMWNVGVGVAGGLGLGGASKFWMGVIGRSPAGVGSEPSRGEGTCITGKVGGTICACLCLSMKCKHKEMPSKISASEI
jgi:hypothetical protein